MSQTHGVVVPAGSGIEINRFVGVFVQFVLLRQIVRRCGVTRLHLRRLNRVGRQKKKTTKKKATMGHRKRNVELKRKENISHQSTIKKTPATTGHHRPPPPQQQECGFLGFSYHDVGGVFKILVVAMDPYQGQKIFRTRVVLPGVGEIASVLAILAPPFVQFWVVLRTHVFPQIVDLTTFKQHAGHFPVVGLAQFVMSDKERERERERESRERERESRERERAGISGGVRRESYFECTRDLLLLLLLRRRRPYRMAFLTSPTLSKN